MQERFLKETTQPLVFKKEYHDFVLVSFVRFFGGQTFEQLKFLSFKQTPRLMKLWILLP
jgi:hypothetical protein